MPSLMAEMPFIQEIKDLILVCVENVSGGCNWLEDIIAGTTLYISCITVQALNLLSHQAQMIFCLWFIQFCWRLQVSWQYSLYGWKSILIKYTYLGILSILGNLFRGPVVYPNWLTAEDNSRSFAAKAKNMVVVWWHSSPFFNCCLKELTSPDFDFDFNILDSFLWKFLNTFVYGTALNSLK